MAINNNVQNVKFLRNGILLGSREAAVNALTRFSLTNEQDGTIILARYGSGAEVKTVAGLVYYADSTNKSVTVIDVEGASGSVEELRQEINAKLGEGVTSSNTVTAQLTALSGNGSSTSAETSVAGAKAYAFDLIGTLDYTDTAETGSYVTEVNQADGKISVSRTALPSKSTVSGDSKVVIDVTQDKGEITATAANLTGVKLDGYAEGTDADIAATDTLGEALGKLQAQINAMDKTADAVAGQVVTTVAEDDGKVTETKANVKDLQLGGYVKDTTATGDIASGDTINAALSKLENKAAAITIANADGSINVTAGASGTDINVNIKSNEHVLAKDGNNGLYTDLDLVKITTGLPETVKERYQLLATDDSQIGVNIDVPKDSHIVSINYIKTGEHAQNLEYVYIDASGNTQTTYVDMSELVLEAEFASGVTVTDHVAHGVVDPASENFLTVGAAGFKVDGVQSAITSAIEALDVTDDAAVAGQYVAAIEETDGVVAVKTRANVSEAVLNNYSKGSDATAVASTDTINQAISKLENQIDAAESAATAAATVIASGSSADTAEHLEIVTTTDSTTNAKTYTFNLKDIASQTDLTALSGKTVTAITSTNGSITAAIDDAAGNKSYNIETDASKIKMSGFTAAESGFTAITEATSVKDAVKVIEGVIIANEEVTAAALTDLDSRLDDVESGFVETVKVNDVALAETDNAVNIQISGGTTAASSANAVNVNTDSSTGAITISLGTIDCGTY